MTDTRATGPPSLAPKTRMRALWSQGDWAAIAPRLDGAARHLVEAAGVGPGDEMLDVAAGNGNVAVWGARAGARVVASDLCASLVAQGWARCANEGVDVEWHEADMEDLPFASGRFDAVLSAFGITFATSPDQALSEMFRVTRPGGSVGLVNWSGDGWAGLLSGTLERWLAGPATGVGLPWGCEEEVRRHLEPHAASIRFERGTAWEECRSPAAWWEETEARFPLLVAARRILPPPAFEAMGAELVDALAGAAEPGPAGIRVQSGYLVVVAEKRVGAG